MNENFYKMFIKMFSLLGRSSIFHVPYQKIKSGVSTVCRLSHILRCVNMFKYLNDDKHKHNTRNERAPFVTGHNVSANACVEVVQMSAQANVNHFIRPLPVQVHSCNK